MRPGLVASLLVLSLAYIVLISAAPPVPAAPANATAPVQASVQQSGDGYAPYAGSSDGPAKEEPYYEEKEEEHACPETKPADAVKEVYLAHGTFIWRNIAAHNFKNPERKRKVAPLNKAETFSGTMMARLATLATTAADKTKAATQAVTGGSFLFPTSIDMADKGILGTTDPNQAPPSEALAVGHHPTDEDLSFVLHAINAQAEVFPIEKGGTQVENVTPTKVDLLDLAAETGVSVECLGISRLAAFYDHEKDRYVLVFSTYAYGPVSNTPPVFLAVSLTNNPLGAWMIWALDLKPDVAQGVCMCAEQENEAFHMGNVQASYSKHGLYISAAATCTFPDKNGTQVEQVMSTLYVFSKDILCRPPEVISPERDAPRIYAAMYHASRSWYRSVTEEELELVDDMYEPFNSYITPARPQGEEDMEGRPLFAMKVTQSHLSIASLTEEPSDEMCDIESAPQIKAVVVGKGADFTNTPAHANDGTPVMHQPESKIALEIKGLGMPEPYSGQVYWASQHKGLLYLVTGEYWGANETRVPSVYWAILKPTDDICQLTREDQGMVASQDGLALAYPVIAGRHDGSAVLAYSYSGAGTLASGMFQAFPGVATTVVGKEGGYGSTESGIDVVQRGPGSLTEVPDRTATVAPWGYNSAAHVCGDEMWFAVPITTEAPAQKQSGKNQKKGYDYGSWLSYTHL